MDSVSHTLSHPSSVQREDGAAWSTHEPLLEPAGCQFLQWFNCPVVHLKAKVAFTKKQTEFPYEPLINFQILRLLLISKLEVLCYVGSDSMN